MLVGVVSDTHNNINNVKNIIDIFNNEKVDIVVHTGDVSKAKTLKMFTDLKCPLVGVFGNNDRSEKGLKETSLLNNFNFQEPPLILNLADKKIAIFHEPELIDSYIEGFQDVDLILHGHTHRYREEIIENTIYFNPGECAGLSKGKNAIGLVNLDNLDIKRIFF
tara:strand:+ start:868 stop:1359 length:492 start_codon:yes stop_codon:yes gene_type:complete